MSGFAAVLSLASLAITADARAATFDEKSGVFRLDPTAAIAASLDDASPPARGLLPARMLGAKRQYGYTTLTASDAVLDASRFTREAVSVEGKGALRVGVESAILLGEPASFASFAAGRVEIRALVRADGAMPELRAIYARGTLEPADASFPSAHVVAYRTGAATSDGWFEISTGPIDGALGTTTFLAGILLVAAGDAPPGSSFLVDALEVRAVPGERLSGGDCQVAREAEQCKKGAVCIEARCLDAAVVYGALPPLETRQDIVGRAATYLTRFQEDRHATEAAAKGFAAEMPTVAATAADPAAFYRRYAALAASARGAHTMAPAPYPFSRIAAGATNLVRGQGSELDACFGIVEKDLAGGGRGYAVYRRAGSSPLAVGDVVDTIDGEPADAWIARLAPEHALLAADPDSDRPYVASSLHALVMRYGAELGVQRCTAPGACEPLKIDLRALRQHPEGITPMECGPRFQLAVTVPSGVDPDAYEAAIRTTSPDGSVALHTNGEPVDDATWVAEVKGAFESGTSRLLVDKRRGDGGGGQALETWGSYLRRGPSYGLFFVSRVDKQLIDGPPGFLADLFGTCSGRSFSGKCALAQLETFTSAPGSLPAKVAWLTVLDGSASDMSTHFAKGAPGVRIFGPNRTIGLFGSLGVMGGFLPGWSGGAVQLGDVREGSTPSERVSGAWRSGRGVEPDEILVQTQSDLVAGRDTMLERARAWLAEP